MSQPATHTWGDPIPGQGNDMICSKCGMRKTVAEANQVPCKGPREAIVTWRQPHHEPFENF